MTLRATTRLPALMLRAAVLLLACASAFSALAGGPSPSRAPAPRPESAEASPSAAETKLAPVPPPEVLLLLVRNALAALNQANLTGNYTVLHGLGSPVLQSQNSPAQLGIVFTALRNQGVDLAPTLVLTPQLSETPAISADGVLRLAGLFPTRPLQIEFIILYRSVTAGWKIEGLSVTAGPPGGAPPKVADPPATQTSPAQSSKKK